MLSGRGIAQLRPSVNMEYLASNVHVYIGMQCTALLRILNAGGQSV